MSLLRKYYPHQECATDQKFKQKVGNDALTKSAMVPGGQLGGTKYVEGSVKVHIY